MSRKFAPILALSLIALASSAFAADTTVTTASPAIPPAVTPAVAPAPAASAPAQAKPAAKKAISNEKHQKATHHKHEKAPAAATTAIEAAK